MKSTFEANCDNPNIGRNRVPESKELTTLLNIARNNKKIIEECNRQLEETRQTYTEIQLRYNQQKQILDGIASELHATVDFIHTVKGQKEAAEISLTRLNAQVHPIRRCPLNVLAYIFKWVISSVPEKDEFETATSLSHVCSQFRKAAIQSPSFWSMIEVLDCCNVENLTAYWTRTVDRVKSVPVRVKIEATDEDDRERLRSCSLDLLPHIGRLSLCIGQNLSATRVCNWLPKPTGQLDHLDLHFEEGNDATPTLYLDDFTRKFPAPHYISISSAGCLLLANCLPVSAVKIRIAARCSMSLQLLATKFPHAQDVTLVNLQFREVGGTVNWPSVQTMTVGNCMNFPWNRLVANNLATFYTKEKLDEKKAKFLNRCISLKYLGVLSYDREAGMLSSALPRLVSLSVNSLTPTLNEDMTNMAELQVLLLFSKESNHLLPSFFGEVDLKQFIPNQRPSSESQKRPRRLKIVIDESLRNKESKWHDSSYIRSAVEVEQFEADDWETYTYTWV